jgi:phenylacetate-coenzyme A ligase PaaK-like adenylate-forming protein
MPFLRYNLNDYADMEDHPDFGVKYIKRIIGRKDDILDLDTGVRLTELHTYEMFMDFHECETFKFIQRPDKSVVLQLKPAKGVTKADLEKLVLERWRKRFGEASLIIEFVDHFKIDPELGKFKNMEKL